MAMVPADDGLRRRKPDAIAACGSGTRGVRPVEAVEIPGELRRVQTRAGIRYGQAERPPSSAQGEADGAVRVAVLDRVIQQNRA